MVRQAAWFWDGASYPINRRYLGGGRDHWMTHSLESVRDQWVTHSLESVREKTFTPRPFDSGRDPSYGCCETARGMVMPTGTLRDQVLAEVEAETWDVEEIGRQLGQDGKPMSRRSVHKHIQHHGLPAFRTPNGRRRAYPHDIAAWLRQRMSELRTE